MPKLRKLLRDEIVVPEISATNRHKVPKKQWRKWCELSRMTFNETYTIMKGNQDLFLHPETGKSKKDHWKTTAWNAAWIAAGSVEDGLKHYIDG